MGSIMSSLSEACKKAFGTHGQNQINENFIRGGQENSKNNFTPSHTPSPNSILSTTENDQLSRKTPTNNFDNPWNVLKQQLNTSNSHQNLFFTRKSRNKILEVESNKNSQWAQKVSRTYEHSSSKIRDILSSNALGNALTIEDFEILKLLGRGTFGKVFLVKKKNDKNEKFYAMKVLIKEKIKQGKQIVHTKNEREILEKINHPFIVKLYYAFQDDEKLYLVTEFMQGGELFSHLKLSGIFSEKTARFYASEVILAIEHLHENRIIYRDLKPENILLDQNGHIKITDFGLSKIFSEDQLSPSSNHHHPIFNEKAFTFCGTPEYLAPEILLGQGYTKSVDWWSFGVLLYEMLIGKSLFKRRRETRLDIKTYLKPIEIPEDTISYQAKDLILSLLQIDPQKRLHETEAIKAHPFFKETNWRLVYAKKIIPEFIPKNQLKSADDVACFDEKFTEDKNHSEMKIFPKKENEISGDIKKIPNDHNILGVNKKFSESYKQLNKEFENFSYRRPEELGT